MSPALLILLFAVLVIALTVTDIDLNLEGKDWAFIGLGVAAGFAALFLWKPSLAQKARSKIDSLLGEGGGRRSNLLRLLARPAARAARAAIAAVVAVAAPPRP